MEGIIGILILGWVIWMFIRHPLKSLSVLFKIVLLFLLGLGTLLVIFYFMMTGGEFVMTREIIQTPSGTDELLTIYNDSVNLISKY
jgi:hypothetical protein